MATLSKAVLLQKKTDARKMLATTTLTQKAIAKEVGVTEKTLGSWIKKYNWQKSDADAVLSAAKGANNLLAFMVWVSAERPGRYAALEKTYNEYIATL